MLLSSLFLYMFSPSSDINPLQSLFVDRDHLRSNMGIISGPGSFAVQFGDHLRSWGLFLERLGKLSGPVSHPVSPRKLFGCFSKFPLFSIALNFPVTCPVIYGRSWPPVKLPESHKCCKTKQMAAGGALFCFKVLSKTPLSSRYGWLRSHWTISALTSKNGVARWGA